MDRDRVRNERFRRDGAFELDGDILRREFSRIPCDEDGFDVIDGEFDDEAEFILWPRGVWEEGSGLAGFLRPSSDGGELVVLEEFCVDGFIAIDGDMRVKLFDLNEDVVFGGIDEGQV